MSVLLYFVSFASIFALFASLAAAAIWLAVKFCLAWARFFRALLNPPPPAPRRRPIDLNAQLLKRAGQ